MRQVNRALMGLLLVGGVSAIIVPTTAAGALRAADNIDHDTVSEKLVDLQRAQANGGASLDRLVVVFANQSDTDAAERVQVRNQLGGQVLHASRALKRDVLR